MQRLTRRRDDDPVKISKGHRVSWYPSGVPGKGDRKQKRCKNRDKAEAFALEKREAIDRHRTRGQSKKPPRTACWHPSRRRRALRKAGATTRHGR